jgi:ribonuclease P/MRP protein subunit POP5
VLPPWREVEQKALYLAVSEAATSLFGDARAAEIQPAVVFSDRGCAILRCRRGDEGDLAVACATVTAAGDLRVALRSVAVSGTIAALKERMEGWVHALPPREALYGEKELRAFRYGRHKVDVLQEGIKKQSIVFLTDCEREEI